MNYKLSWYLALTSFSTFKDNERIYFDMPLDSDFFAGGLEKSEVSEELIIVFGFPVDFGKVDFSGMDNVKNLTIY
jgi:hypothetical protein